MAQEEGMMSKGEEAAQATSVPPESGDVQQQQHGSHRHHGGGYAHARLVKMGVARLDRRAARGVQGNPKKGGHGGKFTWAGPNDEEYDEQAAPAAVDEGDPNFVDAGEGARDAAEAVASADASMVAGPQGRVDLDPN